MTKMTKKKDEWKYTHDAVFNTPIRTKKNGKTQKLKETGDILHPGPRRWTNA